MVIRNDGVRKQWVVAFRRAVGYQERPHIREKKKKERKVRDSFDY